MEAAQGGHGFDSADGFEGAEENASGMAGRLATDVGAVVISVDEIDVGVAGRAEEDGVAKGLSVVGVGAGIDGSQVGFGFDDASGESEGTVAADEKFAEKFAGDGAGIACVKGAGQG